MVYILYLSSMRISECTAQDYPCMNPWESSADALQQCEEFCSSHVFICENGYWQYNIAKEVLENASETTLASLREYGDRTFLKAHDRLQQAIVAFDQAQANILPVLIDEGIYAGSVSQDDLISEIAKIPALATPGAEIVLLATGKSASVAEICQIAERENARILSAYISAYKPEETEISLKILSDKVLDVTDALQRFGYQILDKGKEDHRDDLLKNRYDYVSKILDL